ncbi:MAG: Fimbrial assembly protein [Candidatus Angelobacter sp.]|jgi:type IV pilus assembly protein PilN|nr:Fimbrial assembly protein [Candidatus Angelobacter sp.]
MIRINLLGVPRPKKGKRGSAAAPSMPGEGPNVVMLMVVGIVIGAGAFFYLYNDANKVATKLAADITNANQEGAQLANVKVKYEQRKKEADAFEKRVKVIDQLRAEQAGPVTLLNTIGDSVNNTDAVWLSEMTETAASLNIEGTALSTVAVANLMTTIKRTGYFKNVDFKITSQDASSKEMTAFTFTLTCEKQQTKS